MDQPRIVDLAGGVDPGGDLARRIDFLLEIDQLKTVMRRSRLVDGSRYENTAEHSWHLAMAALVLGPYAGPEVDVVRAVEILLVHDIVEIDAGDTYVYDDTGDKAEREERAARRLFNLLPADQAGHIDELWREYEARSSPTARFAYAIDRLQPLLLNAGSGGMSWQHHGIRHSQATAVNGAIIDGSATLWELASELLAACADEGCLIDDRPAPDGASANGEGPG